MEISHEQHLITVVETNEALMLFTIGAWEWHDKLEIEEGGVIIEVLCSSLVREVPQQRVQEKNIYSSR